MVKKVGRRGLPNCVGVGKSETRRSTIVIKRKEG